MIALIKQLRQARLVDDGFTLIEVVVAIMIFAIISVGVAYTITNSLLFTNDGASRTVATNLASQEIDLDRSITDVFSITDSSFDKVVNKVSYHVTRQTAWVTSGGTGGGACGSTGGTLQFKQVNVTVTWDGMSSRSAAVHEDTVIAPNSRINDPTLGTIIISSVTASGSGTSGVAVSAVPSSPANGATSLASQPTSTDNQGCSYALKVNPGNYDVTLSKSGYVDVAQDPTPTVTVGVGAGTSGTAGFTYDQGVTYNLTYAPGNGGYTIPTNLSTTFRSSVGGNFVTQVTGNSQLLFPFTGGYTTMAGDFEAPGKTDAGCINVDPASWTTPALDGAVGQPLTPASQSGNSASSSVNMGLVTLSGLTNNRYLTAVSQNSPNTLLTGDPGCADTQTYTFKQQGTTGKIALPFGTWKLYSGTTSGATTTLLGFSQIALASRGTAANLLNPAFTLDPRTVS